MKVHIKKRVFEIISKADDGDTASKIFDGFIMALISLSVLSIILESFQDIASKYSSLFSAFETLQLFQSNTFFGYGQPIIFIQIANIRN